MSFKHREIRKKIQGGLRKYDHAGKQESQALEALINAEEAEFDPASEHIQGIVGHPKAFVDYIYDIRDEADEIAVQILKGASVDDDDIRLRSTNVVQRYIALISTTEGQIYRKALFDFDVAGLKVVRKGVQVEHNRERFEEDPTLFIRDVYGDRVLPDFWDKLGNECINLIDPKVPGYPHFMTIHEALCQGNETDPSRWGRYRSVLQGYESINGYGMNLVTHEPSHTFSELQSELFALTSAGNALVYNCILIKGIINNQPRWGKNSELAYGDIGKLVTEGNFPKEVPMKYRGPIQSAVRRFGTLFGYSHAVSDENYRYFISVPAGVGERRNAIYHTNHHPHLVTPSS